jgi:hypothetical protein
VAKRATELPLPTFLRKRQQRYRGHHLGRSSLSNGSRLSCGALKKDSFPESTRAASFKRLLDGAPSSPHLHEEELARLTHGQAAKKPGRRKGLGGWFLQEHRDTPSHILREALNRG